MGSFHDMQEVNSKSPKKGVAVTISIEHKPSANGGHIFTHHKLSDGGYHAPEVHTFGKNEGAKALGHFAKHAGLVDHITGDADSAAGAAT